MNKKKIEIRWNKCREINDTVKWNMSEIIKRYKKFDEKAKEMNK